MERVNETHYQIEERKNNRVCCTTSLKSEVDVYPHLSAQTSLQTNKVCGEHISCTTQESSSEYTAIQMNQNPVSEYDVMSSHEDPTTYQLLETTIYDSGVGNAQHYENLTNYSYNMKSEYQDMSYTIQDSSKVLQNEKTYLRSQFNGTYSNISAGTFNHIHYKDRKENDSAFESLFGDSMNHTSTLQTKTNSSVDISKKSQSLENLSTTLKFTNAITDYPQTGWSEVQRIKEEIPYPSVSKECSSNSYFTHLSKQEDECKPKAQTVTESKRWTLQTSCAHPTSSVKSVLPFNGCKSKDNNQGI